MNADRCAEFYQYVFELKPVNKAASAPGHHLTDGRVMLSILPWSIPIFADIGIKRPGPDHIGFKVEDIDAAYDSLVKRGAHFEAKPMLVAPMETHDLWLAEFRDSENNVLALMCEKAKEK